MNLKIKETISNILQSLLVKQYTMTFPSTVGISYFKVYKCAGLVTIHVMNVNKASKGSNTIGFLPVGWRPKETAALMLIPPVSSISTGGTELSLRLSVHTDGGVELYNYRSAAISGSTNASGTLTFPVGGGYCLEAISRLLAINSTVRGWQHESESEGSAGQDTIDSPERLWDIGEELKHIVRYRLGVYQRRNWATAKCVERNRTRVPDVNGDYANIHPVFTGVNIRKNVHRLMAKLETAVAFTPERGCAA